MKKRPASRTGARRGDSKAPPTNAWPKGKSGNPEGRPKTDPELVEAFRARTPKALATLDKVMDDFARNALTDKGDPLIPAAAAVKASEVVLNRGWGTAPTTVKLDATLDLDAKVTSEARQVLEVDPQRLTRIAAVLQRAGVLPAGGSADVSTPDTKEPPGE